MQGLELSKAFYREYGAPMLAAQFGDLVSRIAVGLAGEGSECLGFDDVLSRDHDFDAGFCLWITQADAQDFGFRLERAYAKLPKEFRGVEKGRLSPVGGNRHGVITIEDFYTRFLGTPHAPESAEQWLHLPSAALAAATSGEVFRDDLGLFSKVRDQLLLGYPDDIRKMKLAGHLVLMAQSGQYNYARCVSRGEMGAAQLAVFEFVRHAISVIYLLNNRYEPFYKWAYRGMQQLSVLGHLGEAFRFLTETDNSPDNFATKQAVIEDVAALIIGALKDQGLTRATCGDLEKHAYSVQDSVKDGMLRNRHIMDGV